MQDRTRGILVTHQGYVEGSAGGVQVCTREYIEVMEAAGIDLGISTFEGDRRLSTRLLRRLNSSPYFRPAETGAVKAVVAFAEQRKPDFVFLNQVTLTVLAPELRARLPKNCKIVVLSHGLESTDLLHAIRLRGKLPVSGRFRPTPAAVIGQAILTESATRADVDLVCVLSPFDLELEKWVGAKRAEWLPRIVRSAPLDWRPVQGRLGFVGTLNHPPNLEGLVQVLDVLHAQSDLDRFRVRLVGGPKTIGDWLARGYPAVENLGPLENDALAAEAASWNAFIHPIFCQARGCSTKLAQAMAWQIPIVTTTTGHRGYSWKEGSLVVADDLTSFVQQCRRLLDTSEAAEAREQVKRAASSSPTLKENAARLRAWLCEI